MAAPRIGAVVVCYESHAVLPALLDSLADHEPRVPVVVIDNASPTGPPDVGGHPRIERIVMDENRGYGAAANVAVQSLRDRGCRYFAFLNPDIRLQGSSLTQVAARMDNKHVIGIASGPVVDEFGRGVQSAFGPNASLRALWFASGWQSRRTRALIGRLIRRGIRYSTNLEDDLRIEGHVLGGVMVVRASCFDEIGGFDEDFFLYWEDADMCERARLAGAEVRIVDCTPFMHAPTTATPGVGDSVRWDWYVAGARTFAQKHLPAGQLRQLDAALALRERLRAIREG